MRSQSSNSCSIQLINTTKIKPITFGSQWSNFNCLTIDSNEPRIYRIEDYGGPNDLRHIKEIKIESLFKEHDLNEIKLSTGTSNPKFFGCHFEKEAKITKNFKLVTHLKTNLPIKHIKISGQIIFRILYYII
ncbi:hypothetical protein ABK040_006876 [Willaertia magna]